MGHCIFIFDPFSGISDDAEHTDAPPVASTQVMVSVLNLHTSRAPACNLPFWFRDKSDLSVAYKILEHVSYRYGIACDLLDTDPILGTATTNRGTFRLMTEPEPDITKMKAIVSVGKSYEFGKVLMWVKYGFEEAITEVGALPSEHGDATNAVSAKDNELAGTGLRSGYQVAEIESEALSLASASTHTTSSVARRSGVAAVDRQRRRKRDEKHASVATTPESEETVRAGKRRRLSTDDDRRGR
ncbi:uncharacterized protein AB675_11843 [Cyphellophora attinorum]|uniref:Uncharacterized protein n=1 Tax=Cyphellophora attinorum TaxID=1664694 RepID=A0A0N1GZW5_9EURO|nr:uncharacterized protein AB675_11843 [Phialophora attinorum]KPI36770.1 hypothetical protein AB675_11843 [Phialophora attinorum]